MTALEKQQALVDIANGLFTQSIIAHTDNGDGTVKFQTAATHNFVVGDYIILYDVMDADNEITTFNLYAATLLEFPVTAKTDDTFTITIPYKSTADLTNLKAKSVFVFNNEQVEINSKEYPVVIIEGKDINRLLNASNTFIPQETEFVLTVLDIVNHHTKGRNTQIKECRAFNEVKMNLVLGTFKKKLISDKMRRGEIIWGEEGLLVSFVDVRIEY